MFGYSDDETPQPDEYFSARVPDNDRTLLSLGFTHDISENITIEASYLNVDIDTREINSTDSYGAQLLADPTNTDPNGTDAYNGDYDAGADVFAIGMTMRF